MPKLYPFKHRFSNPSIKPMSEALWFESHQELLLKIVNTQDGRDLLCIDKSFDGMPIVKFCSGSVTGLMGFKDDKAQLMSDFRVGTKWGNVIRYRWLEFVALAKKHYSHKASNLCRIRMKDEWLLAATTSTFYPSPSPDAPVDGHVVLGGVDTWDQAGWDATHDAASGSSTNDSGTVITWAQVSRQAGDTVQIVRGVAGFNTGSISDTDSIDSGTLSGHVRDKFDDANDANAYMGLVGIGTLASSTSLNVSDYNQVGDATDNPTELATGLDITTLNVGVYNDFTLNGAGLAYIDKTGTTWFGGREGHDIKDALPTLAISEISRGRFESADQTGTATDIKLVIIHSGVIGNTNLLLMGVG